MPDARPILVEVSPGELIDKITILEIKASAIADAAKLANVHHELAVLNEARARCVASTLELSSLSDELKRVNLALWQIEDEIRDCERRRDFGERFVGLARAVYVQNDVRAQLKRQINVLLGSKIVEEKAYAEYR